MLQIKLILIGIGVILAAFSGWKIYDLIGENAVLEASNAGLVQSIIDANAEINDYAINTNVLQQAFKHAALDEGNFNQKVDSHDYEKLARRKPDKLESILNSAIISMWDEVREVTGYPGSTATSETSTSEPVTSDN